MNKFQYLILNNPDFLAAIQKIAAENFGLDSKFNPVDCTKLKCQNCIIESIHQKEDDKIIGDYCKPLINNFFNQSVIRNGELIKYKGNNGIFVEYSNTPGFAKVKIEDQGKIRMITVLISQIEKWKV